MMVDRRRMGWRVCGMARETVDWWWVVGGGWGGGVVDFGGLWWEKGQT
jgi:hypothetical protein